MHGLQNIKAQNHAAVAGIFNIFQQAASAHALLHAGQQVGQARQGMHAGIERDPARQLTRGKHLKPAAHGVLP